MGRSGVYFLIKNKKVVYVGQSNNVIRRIGKHIEDGIKEFDACTYIEIKGKYIDDMGHIEWTYIQRLQPEYNKQHKNKDWTDKHGFKVANRWQRKYLKRSANDTSREISPSTPKPSDGSSSTGNGDGRNN